MKSSFKTLNLVECYVIYFLQSIVYFWSLKSILEALDATVCQLELGCILSLFSLNIANMINETDKKIGMMMIFFLPFPMDVNAKGGFRKQFLSTFYHPRE